MSSDAREPDKAVPVLEHLRELRSRLIVVAIFFVLFATAGYLVHTQVESALLKPLGDDVYYTSITGGFEFHFGLAILIGIFLALPVALYNLLRFAMPALPSKAKLNPLHFIFFSYLGIFLSVAFTYIFALPVVLKFLADFSTSSVKPLISTNEYLNFVKIYFLCFGIVFQLPVVLLTINSFTPLPMKRLRALRKWVIIAAFLFAMLLVPTTNLAKQLISALPIIVLYELTLFIIWVVNSKEKEKVRAEQARLEGEAENLFRSGQYPQAKKLYLELVDTSKQPAVIDNRLGVIYMKEKNYLSARKSFQLATEADPKMASAYANLGAALIELGELAPAGQMLKKALDLKLNNQKLTALTEGRLGKVYLKQRKYKLAKDVLLSALQNDPNLASACASLGIVLIELGESELGRKMVGRSLTLKNQNH